MKKLFNISALRGFALGILTTTLFGGTVVLANPQMREIVFGVNISVNGTVQNFDSDSRPFIMEGRTFLPVAAIGSVLGINVGWDGATSTVLINSDAPSGGQAAPAQEAQPLLAIMNASVTGTGWAGHNNNGVNITVGDRMFANSTRSGASGTPQATFALNGDFTNLTGYLAATTNMTNDPASFRQVQLRVFGDGELLFETLVLSLGDAEVPFDIDVTGVNTLVFSREVQPGSGLTPSLGILSPWIR